MSHSPALPRARRQADASLLVAMSNFGVLLLLFAVDAPAMAWAVALPLTFAVLAALLGGRYVQGGRIVATPGLIFFGFLALYTIPVVVNDLLFDYAAFLALARPASITATALNALAVVLLASDRPRPAAAVAALLERHQVPLCLSGCGMFLVGVLWFIISVGGIEGVFVYLFETSYYFKHIYFEGRGFLGLFSLCFELAGMLSAFALAIPSGRRRYPRAVDAAVIAAVVLFTINQGYRTTIILVFCQYLVARAFWPGAGVRVATLALILGVLAPVFLIWAHARHYLSSGDILDLGAIQQRVGESDWADIHDSELGISLANGGHLLELLDTGVWQYRWGETLVLEPFIALVPRALWPDRPDALQIEFTRLVDPTYLAGGTLSFSYVLEGYLNFGLIGAAAWSGLLAWLLAALHRRAEGLAARDGLTALLAIMVLNSQVWFYIRDDFGDLVRRTALALTLTLAVVGLVKFVLGLVVPAPAGPTRRRSAGTVRMAPR